METLVYEACIDAFTGGVIYSRRSDLTYWIYLEDTYIAYRQEILRRNIRYLNGSSIDVPYDEVFHIIVSSTISEEHCVKVGQVTAKLLGKTNSFPREIPGTWRPGGWREGDWDAKLRNGPL